MKNFLLATLLLTAAAHAQVPPHINYQGRVAAQGTNFHGTGEFKFALVDAGTNLNQTATAAAVATVMITSVSINSGGSGYTNPPSVTIAPPDDPEGVQATATATVTDGVVTEITINEAGSGYFNNPVQITIAPPPENIEHQVYWSNAGDLAPNEVPSTSVSLPVDKGLYSVRLGDTSVANMAAFNPDIFYTPLFLRVWFSDGMNGFQQLTPDQPLASAPYALQARLAETVAPGAVNSAALATGAVSVSKLAAGAAAASIANQDLVLGQGSFTNIVVAGTGGLSATNGTVSAYLFSGKLVDVTFDVTAGDDVIAGDNVTAGNDVIAAGDITYVGTLTDISDARLKDLGTPFTAGLDTVARIEPLHYRFKQGNALGAPQRCRPRRSLRPGAAGRLARGGDATKRRLPRGQPGAGRLGFSQRREGTPGRERRAESAGRIPRS